MTTTMNICARTTISTDPAFQDRLDNADPFVCPQDVLQELLDEAPDQYSQGFLAGIYQFRQQLAILTNRPF